MKSDVRPERLSERIVDFVKSRTLPPKSIVLPILVLCLSAVLLFYNAFRFSMPIASAGLYAQASKEIAQDNFRLPDQIQFYGPGDVPFAYPPLAFYVMAFFTRLGIPDITYLRFMPPLLTLLGLIVLYLLAKRITHSLYAALATLTICAVSPTLYGAHAWASGAVRALAFLFLLCGLYVLDKAIHEGGFLLPALAGVLFGLVTWTHLFYALFFALWLACWVLANPKLPAVRAGIICFLAAVLLSAPWVLLMLSRYGTAPFSYAFVSHGNTSFLDVLTRPQGLPAWIASQLADVTAVPFEIVLVALGLAACLTSREFGMPFIFVTSLLVVSPEGGRFVVLLAAILAGVGGLAVGKWLHARPWAYALGLVVLGLVVLAAGFVGLPGIARDLYEVPDGALALGRYVQENTTAEARYLMLAEPRDGEWFPYLFQRSPFASKWGAEWLGTYDQQISLLSSIDYCRRTRVVECVANLRLPIRSTDILVTLKKDRDVSRGLKSQPACPEMADIGEYVVWKAGCVLAPGTAP